MTQKLTQTTLLITLLISLLIGCTTTPQPPGGEPPDAEVAEAADTPTTAPTATPTEEPEPLPPIVLSSLPEAGAEQPVEAPIEVTFDQPMDRASVEKAFAIEPGASVDGAFDWVDDQTLRFRPDDGFQRGERYRVRVVETARSAEGLAMQRPFEMRFSAVGFLEVTTVQPADGATEVLPETAVTVLFNRPVVPLNAIEAAASLPDPLTFVPPVPGQGEWLNTSIYQFTPADGFDPATAYTARVSRGLTDALDQTELEDDVEWTFTTVTPQVIASLPAAGDIYVSPTPVISLTFNQPMDRASVEANLALVNADTEATIPGQLTWHEGGLAQPTGGDDVGYYDYKYDEGEGPATVGVETVAFTPDESLDFGAIYRIELPAGTRGATDPAATAQDFSAAFTVVPYPAILSTSPGDGDEGIEPWQPLQISFNGPLNPASVDIGRNVIIEPTIAVTQVYSYWWSSNSQLELSFPREASTRYRVTLGPDIEGRYGQPLAEATTVTWETLAARPLLYMHSPGRLSTYGTYTDTLAFFSVRNISQVDFGLYRLPAADFIRLNGNSWWEDWESYRPAAADLIADWTLETRPELNDTLIYRVDLGQRSGLGDRLPPGLYYLEVTYPAEAIYPPAQGRSPDRSPQRQMLVVSRHNLTFKSTASEGLAWLTGLDSGQPVADVPITVRADESEVGPVETDADGVATVEYAPQPNSYDPRFAFAGDPDAPDENFAVAISHWSDGIERYQFDNVSVEDYQQPYAAHFYTDRNIYRPGQTVYFKGIIRADNDAAYSLPPAARPLDILVTDSQGQEIFSDQVSLSDMGTVNGSFELDDNAALGAYSIQAQLDDETYFYDDFQVAAYRKPEFLVEVTADKPEYSHGDTVNVTASAEFFFGGPVSNADVTWTLLSDDYFFRYTPPKSGVQRGWYDFTDYDFSRRNVDNYISGFGERIAEGEGVTDDEGRFTFEVEADIAEKIASQRYTFDVVITDVNNQQVASQAQAVIHKGQFYIGLRPERYVGRVGDESAVEVLVVDWDSQPVAEQEVQVVFAEHNWYSVQKQYEDGGFYWDSVVETVPVFTTTVTTDRDGLALADFTPDSGGIYKISASGLDADENEVRSSTFQWISGREYVNWRQENNDRIDLVADKREYNVGDTATILVPHPYSGTVTALVTLERGHLYEHFVTELETNSEQLEIPITEAMVPNMYVSVVVVKGAHENLPPIGGDRGGESATETNAPTADEATDDSTPSQPPPARGRGDEENLPPSEESGEKNLPPIGGDRGGESAADANTSTDAEAEENLPPIGGDRGGESATETNTSVETLSGLPSFKVGYASLPINTTTKELQITLTPNPPHNPPPTSGGAWGGYQPGEQVEYFVNVINAAGEPVESEMSLALVDKAVLSLTPEQPGQLMETFWRNRGLGVQTGASLALSIDRINLAIAPEAKGGGGGFDQGFGDIRGDFRDTALWLADFTTDENGEGVVETSLPDNLTTWTLTAKGVTGAETLVGEGTVEIVSTKPLLVRPLAPRFFVVGDEARMGMIVQNNSEEPLEVEARFEAEGLEIGDWRLGDGGAAGEGSAGDAPQFEIEPGERIKVEYEVTVQDVAAIELTMGAKALDGPQGDALTFDLPVYRFSTPETVATVGLLDEDGLRAEAIALPRRFDPTQGDLTINIDPSLAAGMRDGLDYLEHFPYECTEQTVSRFLPNVFTFRAYDQLNLDNPALAEKLPDLVSVGLQRLYSQQHVDGGWGWWIRDESRPFLTAYVLLGLVEAQRADFSVDDNVLFEAAAYLEAELVAPADVDEAWQANRQAFMLYALAEAGSGDLGRSIALFQERQKLDIFGRAFLAMAIHILDPQADQIETLLGDITSAAIVSGTGAHWEEAQVDYYSMNTDTRSTAIIIAALSRIQPDHTLLPQAVRWLMTIRENGGHWETTQETAWAIIGLTDWMITTGELDGEYAWQVTLNGDALGEGEVGAANIDETTKLRVEVGDLLAETVNRLAVERDPLSGMDDSPGNLYYAAYLTYFKPVEEVKALDRGIIVSREYTLASSSPPVDGGGQGGVVQPKPITEANVGDIITVKLTLIAPNDLHYVVVEDPFPAGAEGIDTSLATTSVVGQAPELDRTDRRNPWGGGYGWWYFSHAEIRDEKAVLFATFLPKGTYQYTYQIRASLPGQFRVIPTHAEQMYFPEVFGRGDGGLFGIGE